MENAKNTKNPKNENKVKKGDNAKIIERLDAMDEKLTRALPPSPGRFTRC